MATTQPLKTRAQIEAVRGVLTNSPDSCLFTLGVNAAFRGGDLLALNVGDVRNLRTGDELVRKEEKAGKRRVVTLNAACVQAWQALVAERLAAGATYKRCAVCVAEAKEPLDHRVAIPDVEALVFARRVARMLCFSLGTKDVRTPQSRRAQDSSGGAPEGVRALVRINHARVPVHPR